jgi:hypothetical protein
MSQAAIRNALESALAAISPAIDIVHENERYEPIADRPYCEAFVMFATPANPTMGDGFYQEQGVLQVNLQYPTEVGTADSAARAALVRAVFKRGASFASAGITVQIDKTPEIPGGRVDGDRWKVVLRAPFHADIYI